MTTPRNFTELNVLLKLTVSQFDKLQEAHHAGQRDRLEDTVERMCDVYLALIRAERSKKRLTSYFDN